MSVTTPANPEACSKSIWKSSAVSCFALSSGLGVSNTLVNLGVDTARYVGELFVVTLGRVCIPPWNGPALIFPGRRGRKLFILAPNLTLFNLIRLFLSP